MWLCKDKKDKMVLQPESTYRSSNGIVGVNHDNAKVSLKNKSCGGLFRHISYIKLTLKFNSYPKRWYFCCFVSWSTFQRHTYILKRRALIIVYSPWQFLKAERLVETKWLSVGGINLRRQLPLQFKRVNDQFPANPTSLLVRVNKRTVNEGSKKTNITNKFVQVISHPSVRAR